MPLDPVVEAVLTQAAAAGGPPLSEMPPEGAREMYQMMSAAYQKVDMHAVQDMDAGGVNIRVYHPTEEKDLPCLVFFHGGGWVIGDLVTHDNVCRNLASQAGCAVVAADYRLAPEHPFPAPLDDCYTVLNWVSENAASISVDPQRIAVGGDSAGGNLSAAVCLKSKQEGGPKVVHQLLMYPVTDFNFETGSYESNGDGYMLTRSTMEWFFNHYLSGGAEGSEPLVSPLRATDLSGLPTATVITAEFDPLRDEGEAYGEKLQAAGVDTLIKRYDGMIHGFIHMCDLFAQGQEATRLASDRLKQSFGAI